jgi:hypothetical protein
MEKYLLGVVVMMDDWVMVVPGGNTYRDCVNHYLVVLLLL